MNLRDFDTGAGRLTVVQGDICEQEVDVVVNAANAALNPGAGVDGAIHRSGGPEIAAEGQAHVQEHGELSPGEVVSTTAGALPAKRVYHALGPVYRGGNEGEFVQLERAYANALKQLRADGHESIAFPAISTGAFGFPLGPATHVAVNTCIRELREKAGSGNIGEVRLVVYDRDDLEEFLAVFDDVVRTMTG